jgi:GntR family transcriptional regulator
MSVAMVAWGPRDPAVAEMVGMPRRIDRNLPIPLHFQIRGLLVGMIERGEIQAGRPLPPERELALRYGVSLAPIRQAILDLVKEGVLFRRPGVGTFLREPPRTERVSVLGSFSESLRARGVQVDVTILAQERVRTPPGVASVVGRATTHVVLVERLTAIDGDPAAVLRSHLPSARFPGLERATLPTGSLYRYLEDAAGVVPMRAETTVQVVPCTTTRSEQLRMAAGAPLLQASGAVFDGNDDVIEAFEVQYRPDVIRLRFDTLQSAEDVVGGGARAP